ncbi:MAG: hypothetical protein E7052_01745 [Lentisphaerae bacterium]|nr:hypothetical protein [Lentisphaerota bacterium]
MAQVEYFDFGRDIYLDVDSSFDSASHAGLIINIKGELDLVFGSTSGEGALSDMYTIALAPGQTVVLDVQKTTSVNTSKLKVGTFTYNYNQDDEDNAERATAVSDGHGLTVVTAADGNTYRLLTNNSSYTQEFYVSVAMVRRTFDFGLSDVDDIVDLVEEVDDLYDDEWSDRLERVLDENINPTRDMIDILKEEFPEVRDIVADAEDILGTNPLLTYQLNVTRLVDNEAPVMSSKINAELHGDDLSLTWNDAADNFFVSEYNVKLYNSSNQLVKQLTTPIKTFYANDLALGSYTAVITARDYCGNWSSAVRETITVDGTADGFKRGASGKLTAKVETAVDTFTITEKDIYRWQDVALFPAANGTLTLKLYNSKGKNIATATYKNGALTVKKDFSLAPDTYTIKATSSVNGSYSMALTKLEIQATANNTLPAASTIALDKDAHTTVAGYVGSGDAADYYKLAVPGAGLLTVTPELMDNKMLIEVYNTAGKKIKSATAQANKLNGLTNVLITEKAAYIGIVSSDKGKGGYNNNYSASVSFTQFKNSEYDSMYNPQSAIGLGASEVEGWIGYGDQFDYYSLNLTSPGSYTLEATQALSASSKLTIYVKTDKGYKKVKSVSGTKPAIKGVVLDSTQQYVVELQTPKAAKGAQTDYALKISGIEFTNANKYLDHQQAVLNNTSNAPLLSVATQAKSLIDDEWVGYGDEWDYRRMDLSCSGGYTFDFTTDGPSELGIYQAVSSAKGVKLKKIKTVSSTKTTPVNVQLKNLVLTAGTYYIGVRSTKPGNSAGANYSVSINGATEFYTKCDNGQNNFWSSTAESISTTQDGSGWVGFADAVDVFKINSDGAGVYTLNLSGIANSVKLTVFEVVGSKEKSLTNITVKGGSKTTAAISLGTGKYYARVEATGAKKGKNSDYTLSMTKQASFDLTDNGLIRARDAAPAMVWEGAVDKKIDPTDWFDLAGVNELSLDVTSGSIKAVFYDANGQKIKLENIRNAQGTLLKAANSFSMTSGNSKSDNIYIADIGESFRYLAIEGSSKPASYIVSFD